MISYLEKVPQDVLQYIARLTVSSSPFEPLTNILHLALTNSTIYRRLSIQQSPHLYSRIFQYRFDTAAPRRRLHASALTDSSLTAELVQRCRLFRRIRRRDLTGPGIERDMWTLYWLILENDTLNAAHLTRLGCSEFLLEFILNRMRRGSMEEESEVTSQETFSLALWSYCLMVSQRDVTSIQPDSVQELLVLLRPFAMSARKETGLISPLLPCSVSRSTQTYTHVLESHHPVHDADGARNHYSRQWRLRCPDAQSAAIIMTFVFKELVPLQVPPHLPPDRITAIAQNRGGPTMDDYRALASCRTPLFNDLVPGFSPMHPNPGSAYLNVLQSMRLDQDFSRMVIDPPRNTPVYATSYSPGMMSGLWEGTFMISPIQSNIAISSDSSFIEDFVARKPMYCQLTEYLCHGQHMPIPTTQNESCGQLCWDYHPNRLIPVKEGFQMSSKIFHYEKLVTTSRSLACREINSEVNDVLIVGETPAVREDAWGGYRLAGKVRLSDGFVTLKRVSKDIPDDPPWTFEGFLHYGEAFVGTWRTHGQPCAIEGVFSMRKRLDS